jgi:hypothetical protein
MTMQDQLVVEVTRSPDTVLRAMQIIAAHDAIREKLLSVLREQIEAKLVGLGWRINEWDMKSWEPYSGFSIEFSPGCPFTFDINFQHTQYNGLIFGLPRINGRTDNDTVALAITNDIGPGRSSPRYIWYRYSYIQDQVFKIDYNWLSSPTTWVAISDGTMATNIVTVANRFYVTLKNCGLL